MNNKVIELRRMKALCVLLLLVCIVMSIVLEILFPRTQNIMLVFLKGAFEAAVVGAMADWYAVVALFRHPLGISALPHTAIIPRKKDAIGENLGKFVQNEFMDDAVVINKVKEFDPIEKLFIWIEEREKNYVISAFVKKALISLLTDKTAHYIHEFSRTSLEKFINETNASEILAQLILLLNDDKNRNDIFDKVLDLILSYMDEQRDHWINQVKQDGYWGLNIVGVPYVEKFLDAIYKNVDSARSNNTHQLREMATDKIKAFINDLQYDPQTIQMINTFKRDLMQNDRFLDFINSAVTHVKEKLIADLNSSGSYVAESVHTGILALVKKYRSDDAFRQYLNESLDSLIDWLLQHKAKIAEHLADQVKKWTPDSISQKLELEIGKDLQWIRVSGTLVGGLVGGVFALILHFLH